VADDKVWLVVLVVAGVALLFAAVEYGPFAWTWLTSSEDLGMRLRRECETVVREAHPESASNDRLRESYVRQCIDARAKVVRQVSDGGSTPLRRPRRRAFEKRKPTPLPWPLTAAATEPAWNGYLLTVACPCGVVFERWATPQGAEVDLLRAAGLN